MNIIITIIPIFIIILIGWAAKKLGFIRDEFMGPANRLVYYLAIPAMIFQAISKASIKNQFDLKVLIVTFLAILIIFAVSWASGLLIHIGRQKMGTYIQNSFHGNLGYIGLAVAFYYLGDEGLVRAGILAGFIMILQNFLAVFILQFYSTDNEIDRKPWYIIKKIMGNPIIWSAGAGIIFSYFEWDLPIILDRSLKILSGLALPMALLIIGASLSFRLIRQNFLSVLSTGFMKLVLLPGIGIAGYYILGSSHQDYLPGLILLASPTATVTYVMARELKGDPEYAVAAISLNTLLSAVTFAAWLSIAG